MQAVANHPSTRCGSGATKSPISSLRETTIIIAAISGTEITPLRTALQNKRPYRIERRIVDRDADEGGEGDHGVEPDRFARLVLEADFPAAGLADGIGRRARQDRHGKQTRADDAEAEQGEREVAGDRAQRLRPRRRRSGCRSCRRRAR